MTTETTIDPSKIPDEQLSPDFQAFVATLRGERKKLLQEKAWQDPAQLRAFIGQHLYPRMIEVVKLFGFAYADIFGFATETHERLRDVENELDDYSPRSGAASSEQLEKTQGALYALGSLLQAHFPEHKEIEAAYNHTVDELQRLVEELLGRPEPEPEDASPPEGESAAPESVVVEEEDES